MKLFTNLHFISTTWAYSTRCLSVLVCLVVFGAFSAATAQQFVPPTEPGVVYANVGGKDLLLDVYVPENPQKPTFPVIVWLHGGTWFSGNKNGFGVNYAASMVKSGFVVICANYVTNNRFPAQLHNCKAVIRWIRANAGRFKMDTTKIGVWGEGAGGHLAALLGCTADIKNATSGDVTIDIEGNVGPHIGFSSRVHAVVDLYGPTDFLKMDENPVEDCASPITHNQPTSPEALLLGAAITTIPDKVKLANPVFYVTSDDPPFLIQHGTADCNVPPNQSELLDEALNKAGVSSTLDLLDGYRHWDSGFYSFGNLRRIRTFFEQAFSPKPAASNTQEDNSR